MPLQLIASSTMSSLFMRQQKSPISSIGLLDNLIVNKLNSKDDGTGYIPNELAKVIGISSSYNEEYIPKQLAQSKVIELSQQLVVVHNEYGNAITSYESSIDQYKRYYESLLAEAKEKGLEYANIQKEMKEKLMLELSSKETIIDEFRDKLAAMSLENQEAKRLISKLSVVTTPTATATVATNTDNLSSVIVHQVNCSSEVSGIDTNDSSISKTIDSDTGSGNAADVTATTTDVNYTVTVDDSFNRSSAKIPAEDVQVVLISSSLKSTAPLSTAAATTFNYTAANNDTAANNNTDAKHMSDITPHDDKEKRLQYSNNDNDNVFDLFLQHQAVGMGETSLPYVYQELIASYSANAIELELLTNEISQCTVNYVDQLISSGQYITINTKYRRYIEVLKTLSQLMSTIANYSIGDTNQSQPASTTAVDLVSDTVFAIEPDTAAELIPDTVVAATADPTTAAASDLIPDTMVAAPAVLSTATASDLVPDTVVATVVLPDVVDVTLDAVASIGISQPISDSSNINKIPLDRSDPNYATELEKMEDDFCQLKQDYQSLQAAKMKVEKEYEITASHLIELTKEKRSDIIAKYIDDIEDTRKANYELQAVISSMKTDKSETAALVLELQDRVKAAESELKVRDKIDIDASTDNDGKRELTVLLGKQRDDLIMKNKAATAGWNAVAVVEEKFESETSKSYQAGIADTNKVNALEMKVLNEAIELKDSRIAELMDAVSSSKRRLIDAEEQLLSTKQELDNANQEIVDTIHSLSSSGVGGGVAYDMEEEHDAMQDELLELTDKYDKLYSQKQHMEKLLYAYEQLVNNMGIDTAVAAPSAIAKRDGAADAVLSQLLKESQDALVEGGGLWNKSKKDEAYEAYKRVFQKIVSRGKTLEAIAVGPLQETLQACIALESQNGMKAKNALVLRKSLTQFIDKCAATQRSNASSAATAIPLPASVSSDHTMLLNRISMLRGSIGAAAAEGGDDNDDTKESSIVRKYRNAEKQIHALKNVIATITSEQQSAPAAQSAPSSDATTASRVDGVEVRKLQRRIKELEAASKNGYSNASSVGTIDKKTMDKFEKKFQKQIKDMEVSFRKEKAALEGRAVAAEDKLRDSDSVLPMVTKERDALLEKMEGLDKLVKEGEILRDRAMQCDVVEKELSSRTIELQGIAAQLTKESAMRKKYKNELEDLKGAIRVFARCRPMATYELEKGCSTVVEIPNDTTVKVKASRGDKEFEFDTAFPATCTQDEVFEDAKRLVESCIDGFNVCIFAYGQTGSGKTFTMTGSKQLPGLTPKTIDEMYRLFREKAHCTFKVSTYFVELYNDSLVDLYYLLDNKGKGAAAAEPPKLEIKMDTKKMVFIKNAIIKDVSSADELMLLFDKGNMERHVGATKMNAESSRSHSIFSILIECIDSVTKKTTYGKLSLVDLAGSERADKTGAAAERLKEAQSINKSLSALGDVIAALSEGDKFIPYRNNKLTQLMQDSLGGNAKTLMFVNFSPADYNADETVTSLNYATRVKKITNNAAKQAETEEVTRLKSLIKKLRAGERVTDDVLGDVEGTEA